MRLSKRFPGIFVVFLSLVAFAGESAHPGAAPSSILPKQFGGWQVSGTAKSSADPAAADPSSPRLLKEYGFTDFESATYARDDGRQLTIKAARFIDATGAYGAFTYYRIPQMLVEKIGDQAASFNERVLFMRGNVLIDAVFSKLSAMSAGELRELASNLPAPAGNAANLPSLPSYLPKQSMIANSIKYALGPVAIDKLNAPLSAELVDFDAGAEVVQGSYKSSGGDATVLVISYPTPQIATEHLRRMDAAQAQSKASPFFDRRSGPIVVVAAGPFSASEAKALLTSVNYDADVTWNENTYVNPRDNVGSLLVNVIILCGIILGFALVAGVSFGGIRILVKRFFPDRVFDRPEEMEFIALHLSETGSQPSDSKVSRSIEVG
jgi:hypothetical protein